MSNNSPASIFGGFTPNEFDELVKKINNNETIYHAKPKELVACPECLGDGTLTYERPEPWVSRDTPPSLEEYTRECWACHGSGETEVDEIDF